MDEGTLLLRLACRQSLLGSSRSPDDVLSIEFLSPQSPKYQSSSLFEFRYGRNLMWYLGWMKALCFFDWRVDSLFRVQQVATRRAFNGIPHPESKVPLCFFEFEFATRRLNSFLRRNSMWYLGLMKALCFFDWRVDSLFRVQQVARRRSFNGIPHPESKVPKLNSFLGRIPRRRVVLGMDEGTLLLRLACRQSLLGPAGRHTTFFQWNSSHPESKVPEFEIPFWAEFQRDGRVVLGMDEGTLLL